jgi:hypothetical protein
LENHFPGGNPVFSAVKLLYWRWPRFTVKHLASLAVKRRSYGKTAFPAGKRFTLAICGLYRQPPALPAGKRFYCQPFGVNAAVVRISVAKAMPRQGLPGPEFLSQKTPSKKP